MIQSKEKEKKVERMDWNNYLYPFQRLTKACSLSCTILRRRLVQGTRSLRIGTCHSCGRPCFSPGRKGGSLHLQAKDNQPPRPRDIKDPVPASRATIYLPAHPLSSFLANSPPSLSPDPPPWEGARWHSVTTLATFPTLSTGLLRQCQPGNRWRSFREINLGDWKASVVQHFPLRVNAIDIGGETFPSFEKWRWYVLINRGEGEWKGFLFDEFIILPIIPKIFNR